MTASILPFPSLAVPLPDGEWPLFVDWLTIRQSYPGASLPLVSAGLVIATDADGEVEFQTVRNFVAEGSFDSRSVLRCDGTTVEYSGNISRYCRPDNVFGYSLLETLRRINQLLGTFQLPPFTAGTLTRYADSGWVWSGARISRIDLTCNYAAGSFASAQAVLLRLGELHTGRQAGAVTPDAATVAWGYGSKYASQKVYLKAVELKKHQRSKSGKHVDAEVVSFCSDVGMLREEITLKSRFLTQNNLAYLGAVNPQSLMRVYRARSQMTALRSMTIETQDTSALSAAAMGTYSRWLAGEPHSLNRRTFYRHRRQILDVLGVDISVPKRNVVSLKQPIKVIEVQPMIAPAWYRQRFG